jgi:hypothetical protein
VTFGRIKAQVNVGAYNLLNSSATMALNSSYTSGHWKQPTVNMEGRIIKFGFQFDY